MTSSRKIGSGSFGDVLVATYKGAEVAIKKSSVLSSDKGAIHNERRFFASIPHHPNVVHVLGVCKDTPDRQLWIVMELAAFGSVQSQIQSELDSGQVMRD